MKIKFEKMCSEALAPTHNNKGDAGLDFYSVQHCLLPKQSHRVIQSGIRVEVPEGFVGLLFPKGSNVHLLGAGVIDTYYEGELLFKVVNYSNSLMVIHIGDPIGQMIIVPFVEPEPVQVLTLESRNSERKDTGGIKGGLLDKNTPRVIY